MKDREQVKVAFEIAARFDTVEMIKARTHIKQKLDSFIDAEVDGQKDENDPQYQEKFYGIIVDKTNIEDYAIVRKMLGMAEDVSLAIQYHYADEEILNLSLRQIICQTYTQFMPYIKQGRKNTSVKELHIELEKLYEAWSKGKSLVTGKEIFPHWDIPSK